MDIFNLLKQYNLVGNNYNIYNIGARDNKDIIFYQCDKTKTIFVKADDYLSSDFYLNKKMDDYWNCRDSRQEIVDSLRRADQFLNFIYDKDILDVGCGKGSFLKITKNYAKSVTGVKIQKEASEKLRIYDIKVLNSVDESTQLFDSVFLFHVLEHISNPIDFLERCYKKVKVGGYLIIEVPNPENLLLNVNVFRQFSMWSEHIILLSYKSILKLLKLMSFNNIKLIQYNRYGLINNVRWLFYGQDYEKENNFQYLKFMNNLYTTTLRLIKRSDTLIFICQKKG